MVHTAATTYISAKLDCLDKREVTSSESRGYMGIPGKGLTTSLDISTKMPYKKQQAGFSITAINNQDIREFLKSFNNYPYIGYKKKQVYNEPTEACIFLIKQITKLIKSKRRVWICIKGVKLDAN